MLEKTPSRHSLYRVTEGRMTQHEDARGTTGPGNPGPGHPGPGHPGPGHPGPGHPGRGGNPDRPIVSRRNAFAPASPRHAPIAAAPTAAASHIPDKLYFRIGEVASLCDVQTYVLRFWETEFPQLRPTKGGTGQRLFRRRDVEMALRIRHLLYDEGYTIPGARQLLKTETRPRETQLALVEDATTRQLRADRIRTLYRGLCDLYGLLSGAPGTLKSRRPRMAGELFPHAIDAPAQLHPRRPTRAGRSPAPAGETLPASESLFGALEPDLPRPTEPPGAPHEPTAAQVNEAP